MTPGRVVFGSFDAESRWRRGPSPLPVLALDGPGGPEGGMDELLSPLCAPGDLLWTRYADCPEHAALLREVGLDFEHRSLENATRCDAGPVSVTHRNVARDLSEGVPDELAAAVAVGAQLVPYAVTDDEASMAARLGVAEQLPTPDVVRTVNSKFWSHRFRQKLRPGPVPLSPSPEEEPGFGSQEVKGVRSRRDLRPESWIADGGAELRRIGGRMLSEGPLLVKEPHGVSGRGSILVESEGRLDRLARHLERAVAIGARPRLLLERYVPGGQPFSAHMTIDSGGGWELAGFRRSFEVGFGFVGSGPLPARLREVATAAENLDLLATVAGHLHASGYHGPACADLLHAPPARRPYLLEINARYSLGRLALELERRLERGPLTLLGLRVEAEDPPTYPALQSALAGARLLLGSAKGAVLPMAVNSLPTPDPDPAGNGRRRGTFYAALVPGDRPPNQTLAELSTVLDGLGLHQPRRQISALAS